MNINHLTEHQINLISLKLAADNNAMLRILLENQLKIMDILGISDAATKYSFESVTRPVDPLPEDEFPLDELSRSEFKDNITAANLISDKLLKRLNEWVQIVERTGKIG